MRLRQTVINFQGRHYVGTSFRFSILHRDSAMTAEHDVAIGRANVSQGEIGIFFQSL
jgi:hypothetical protein